MKNDIIINDIMAVRIELWGGATFREFKNPRLENWRNFRKPQYFDPEFAASFRINKS